MQDFWRRWHISLSTWFRDYLYIPWAGAGHTPRTFLNLVAVFFLCGLWHGAGWTFVLWGLYHGLFLAAERTPVGAWLARLPAAAQRLYTLLVVMCGWVLFRAADMAKASAFFSAMFGLKAAWGHAARYLPNDVRLAMLAGSCLPRRWRRRRRCESASLPAGACPPPCRRNCCFMWRERPA